MWRAHHLALQSVVAVKLIDPAIAGHPEALARFMREAQAAAALRSPHVVNTFDYGVHDGVPFIAMELLEGESLGGRVERMGRLSPEETANVITQVARAIGRAHEGGIVHRDLKPDNIFLVANDDEEVVKVLDFGIAKATGGALGTSSQTRTGTLLGTPYYMSPEQAEGNKRVDHRTDLWAMAVIAFECITGRRPFDSDALGDLVLQICVRPIPKPSQFATVPANFDEWFARATQRDPSQRFQSARELADELRAAVGLARRGHAASPGSSLPQRPGPSTMGGASVVRHPTTGATDAVSAEIRRKKAPVGLVLGATGMTLALLGAGAFVLVSRSASVAEALPSAEPAAPAVPTTQEPPATIPAAPAEAPRVASVAPALPPASSLTVAVPSATSAPAPRPRVARSTARRSTGTPAAKAPAPAPRPTAEAAPQPTSKPKVDFGF